MRSDLFFLFQDDEMQSIRDLIDSAIIDPNVKGGLRWPLDKASSGKYNVVGVWHVIAKAYKNQSLSFKVRHADRFDFRTSIGEASWEINLRLVKVVAKLKVSATISLQHLQLPTSYYIHLSIGGQPPFLSIFRKRRLKSTRFLRCWRRI